jgi:hypothetical protein
MYGNPVDGVFAKVDYVINMRVFAIVKTSFKFVTLAFDKLYGEQD